MKKITFIACLCWLVTFRSFGLLNAQTMTFDTGASETGFTFSQWQVMEPQQVDHLEQCVGILFLHVTLQILGVEEIKLQPLLLKGVHLVHFQ